MITKSLVSYMSSRGYELNTTETKIGGTWWQASTVFYNAATGKWKTVNLAEAMMLEASYEN